MSIKLICAISKNNVIGNENKLPWNIPEDLKRFKYIKRLLNRYLETDDLAYRLLLNHFIVVFNMFGIEAALNILELKLEDKHWPVVKPFLIFLKYINNDEYTGITMDPTVVEKLRKI